MKPFSRHCACPDYWDRCPKCGHDLPRRRRRPHNRGLFTLVAIFALIALAILSGCASSTDYYRHLAKVEDMRAMLPYNTRITGHSMAGVLRAGTVRKVEPLQYDRLESSMIAVFWPVASPTPVAHYVWARLGTDSWRTVGIGQREDLALQGFLLTRDNYIGVIRNTNAGNSSQ